MTHEATRNKNCAALFVVLSYCNLVGSGGLQVTGEKLTAESSVMRLSCSAEPCPVGATRENEQGKKQKQENPKKYFRYSIKDKFYP